MSASHVGDADVTSRCLARLLDREADHAVVRRSVASRPPASLTRPRLVILDELTQGLDLVQALCDRVVVMRDGRIVDQGAPAALVARHAGPVVVRFSIPAEPVSFAGDVRRQLEALPGIDTVEITRGRAVLRGSRQVIAHAGAWLVAAGRVPEDLHVEVPGLESALVSLLGEADPPAVEVAV